MYDDDDIREIEWSEELDEFALDDLIKGTSKPGAKISVSDADSTIRGKARTIRVERQEMEEDKKAKRIEVYQAMAERNVPLDISEIMKSFKYGYGKCMYCKRWVGSTKNGKASRHGHTKRRHGVPCPGSSNPLLHFRSRAKWEERRLV